MLETTLAIQRARKTDTRRGLHADFRRCEWSFVSSDPAVFAGFVISNVKLHDFNTDEDLFRMLN